MVMTRSKTNKDKKNSKKEQLETDSLSDNSNFSDDSNLSDISNDISDYETESEESEEELTADEKSSLMVEKAVNNNTRANNLDMVFTTTDVPSNSTRNKRKLSTLSKPVKPIKPVKPVKPIKKSMKAKKNESNKKVNNGKKLKKNKDDSENSDINLDECSSANDENYTDAPAYQHFVDEVVETMVEDAHNNIQKKKAEIRDKRWKKNLNKRDIKKYEPDYKNICDVISVMPTIESILKINMPFKAKCDLMEQLIILDNMQPDTFEHLNLKTSLNEEINKFQKSNLDKSMYAKYTDIEKKLESISYDELPLKYKILRSDMSFDNKIVVYRKYKYWDTLSDSAGENAKLLNWINIALNIPTKTTQLAVSIKDGNVAINKFLYDVKYILNEEIYGMENVKEQILCILNNKITNPNLIGSSLGLVGSQGVGKTNIIKVLAKAVSLSFTSISLGGMSDSDHFVGHSFTYEGSRPGIIVDSLIQMKSLNGIIFLDEIDKISKTTHGEEISKMLLHLCDFTQNHEFCDKYLGNDIKINLSQMWFIYSLNYKHLIDKTLLDRLTIIEVAGYSDKQKKEMTLQYLLPASLKNINLTKGDITFSDEALNYIIEETNKMYDDETKDKNNTSGVRKLKDAIGNLVMKINYLKNIILDDGTYGELKPSFSIPNFKLPFVIQKEHVDKLAILAKSKNEPHMGMYN